MRTLVILALSAWCFAQTFAGNGGSAYTAFGIGDIRFSSSARSMGMGSTGLSLQPVNSINAGMPASWSRINYVRIDANGLYEGTNTAETNRRLYQAKGLFNGALLAIPVSQPNGIVFVGGLTPYSFVGYNTSFTSSQSGVDYTINEIGSGGLFKGVFGLSYAPAEDVALGASLNYLFGSLTRESAFLPLRSDLSGGSLFVEHANRGVNFTLSGIFSGFGKWSEGLRHFSLGIVLTTEASMTSDVSKRMKFTNDADTISVAEKSMSVPVVFGIGASYQLGERWLLAADFHTQAWSGARFDGRPFDFTRNSSRFGLGAERIPLKEAGKWLDKLAYRLGVSYHQTYYQIYGVPINELAFTTGFTLPVTGETRFTVGIEYALRGEKKSVLVGNSSVDLVKDTIIRVALSLSIAEPWFMRYEEE